MHNVLLADSPSLSSASSAILTSSAHFRSKKKKTPKHKPLARYVLTLIPIARPIIPRTEALYDTKSYNDGLQRAFNKAKRQIFFNPDMRYFITLTYKGADHSPEDVLTDVKHLMQQEIRKDRAKRGRIKYIYIMEYQERGSIHVHMIANDLLSLQVNKNGYKELVYWRKGFSSVLTIQDFDDNFRPYLYLFKYMRKAQRIGQSFVHSSRNLNNVHEIQFEELDLNDWNTKTQERTEAHVQDLHFYFYKYYLKRDILPPQLK